MTLVEHEPSPAAALISIEERVDRGVAWLDANVPGWLAKIDLGDLDLSSPCACVLGQTFAHVAGQHPAGGWGCVVLNYEGERLVEEYASLFGEAPPDLDVVPVLPMAEAARCGFTITSGPDDEPTDEFAALTRAWKRRIRRLRAA